MASTLTLENTLNFVAPYVNFRPLAIGSANEPALTMANIVQQTIIGPPFCWWWNRVVAPSFALAAGQGVVGETLPSFNFIDTASVDGFELEVKDNIATTTIGTPEGRPAYIAAQSSDLSGTIVYFAFEPVPDKTYQITIQYQPVPTPMLTLIDNWWAIPDNYSYIYNFGFLALAMAYANDPRATQYSQMFKGHLLGIAEGLDEIQKTIFMERWDRSIAGTQATMLKAQQGVQARAL